VQDNEYATWNAFNNEYWPNDYLVDIDGYIVDQHSGEGDYAQTEAAIQQALAERAARMGTTTMSIATSTVNIPEGQLKRHTKPRNIFWLQSQRVFGQWHTRQSGVQAFTIPDTLNPNTLYLGGSWDVEPEYAANQAPASIVYEYSAHDINLVASGGMAGVTLDILLDGKPVGNLAGTDTKRYTLNRIYKGGSSL